MVVPAAQEGAARQPPVFVDPGALADLGGPSHGP
jgi:hypothetical protein